MAKEMIVINEPKDLYELSALEAGTLLQIEGKVIKVEEDSLYSSGCSACILSADRRLEKYCVFANCLSNGKGSGFHFVEIGQRNHRKK
jgi:hypothetical protein